MKTIIISLAFLCSLFILCCGSSPAVKKADTSRKTTDNATTAHLISDYSGMKEDDMIAAAWVDSGFRLEQCSEVAVQPVLNLSMMEYPHAQEKIESALRKSIEGKKKTSGGASVSVTSAITALRGKPGFSRWFSPTYEDMPSIELELVISDARSKRELLKCSHMARGKDPGQALEKMLKDMTAFLDKKS